MGKKLNGWKPPMDAIVDEPQEQKSSWTPPEDSIVEEPLKKKDESELNSLGSNESTEPGKPSSKSTTKNTPSKKEIKGSLNDPFGIGETIFKQIQSGVADQIPKAFAQAAEVGVSAMQPANMQEYIKRNKHVEFQKYVREKAGLSWYQGFDIDKYLPQYQEQFIKDKGYGELKSKLDKKQPDIIQRRLDLEKYVQQQNKESAEKMGDVPQSYKDVGSVKGAVQYAANLAAQGAWQIPLVLATKGLSGVAMESAEVYDQQVDQIAEKEGISREEVIKRGLDKPAEGQLYALAAAGLDRASAGGLLSLVKKGGAKLLKTALAVTNETLTEPTQGMLEEMGGAAGAGQSVPDAFVKAWTTNLSKRLDEAAGGLLGSAGPTIISAVNENNVTTPKGDLGSVINQEQQSIDTNNAESIQEAANNIEQVVNQTQTQPNEEIKTEPAVNTESEPAVVPETQAEEGAQVQEQNKGPETETINNEENAVQEPSAQENESNDQQNQKEVEQFTPPEDADVEEQPTGSGIKKELVPDEVVDNTPVDKRTDKEVLDQGKKDVDEGKINPQAIIDSVNKDARALQPNEVAALVYHKAKLDNQVVDASDRLQEAIASGDQDKISSAQAELDELNNQLNQYYEVSVKTANQQSMAFRLRKMLLDSEYNLQSQVSKYKAANKGNIPDEVLKKFEDLDKQLKEANLKIDKLQSDLENQKSNGHLNLIREKEQKARAKLITEDKKKKISTFFDSLKVDTKNSTVNASVIPGITLLPHVWNGSLEAIKQAVLTGADVANAIQAGIDYIKANSKEPIDEDKFTKGMDPLVSKIVPKVKSEESSLPKVKDGKISIPNSLIKELVANGVTDINELTDQIHSLIKETNPEITRRDVRDAITKYGKVATMSQDELDVKIREMKRVGRLLSQLDDIQKKIRPLRSGLQRDKLTDEERKLQREVRESMKDLPVDDQEETRVLKTELDKIKSRLTNQIADLEDQIAKGEKTPKKKGIEYDSEAMALQAKRDELKKVLQDIEGKQGIPEEQKIRMAEQRLEKAIGEYERRIKEKDFSKKDKPTPAQSKEINELKAKRDAAKEQYDQLRKESGVVDKERLELRKKAVEKATKEFERRIKEKDFVTKKKEPIQPDSELSKALQEREKIKYEFQVEQERARLSNRSLSEKVTDFGLDVVNLPKSLLSSLDFSAALRQGGYLLPSHPISWAKAFVEMFRQAASQKRYDDWLLNVKTSDIWPLIQQSKLFISDTNNAKMSAHEEQFVSRISKKIPILGQSIRIYKNLKIPGLDLIGASNRAYSGFLNNLRLEVFSSGVDQLQKDGKTFDKNPDDFKSWADFVNNATGRGKLLKAGSLDLEKAAPVLNTLFFSPRFLASRLNLMNPAYYAKLQPTARKEALKSSLAFLAFGMAVLAMFAADDDWEVEMDPRSTDFGKIKQKNGNLRYDIWGGFQGTARFLAQIFTGEKKNSKGEIVPLDGKKFGADDRLDVVGRFVRGKLAPVPGSIVNALKGENIVGEETTLTGELIKNSVPLYLQDLKDIIQKDGAAGILQSGLPAMFGIGVQNYAPKKKKEKDQFNLEIKDLELKEPKY